VEPDPLLGEVFFFGTAADVIYGNLTPAGLFRYDEFSFLGLHGKDPSWAYNIA
jgi:hypothetical protein